MTNANTETLSLKRVGRWLLVIVFACYLGSVTGEFHFDDSHSVQGNLAIRSFENLPSLWTDNKTSSFIPENRVYRPLVYTFYTVCWWIGGGATWPFHLMKMFFHAMVALALFAIWRRLWSEPGWFPPNGLKFKLPLISHIFTITPEWAAFFLALIFAVHPAGSECAVYISATTSLQCAMFYVWAYYQYLRFRDTRDKKHLFYSLGLYFLSMASKEEGITLPATVLLTELFLNQGAFAQRLRTGLKRFAPYAALGVVLLGWYLIMRSHEGDESRGPVSPFHYFITQWRAYLWYMRLWFWPWDLNADVATLEFSRSLSDPLAQQAAIGNLCVLALAWFNRARFPALLFGVLWFYITISPASSVVPLAEAINEHRMYLAYIGFVGGTFTVLLWAAEKAFAPATRARNLGWLYCLILIGLVAGAQERNRVWLNAENLWTDTVAKNPTSGRALNNLALVYMARADYPKAIELLDKCIQHWSTYMYCPLNKGISLQAMGKMKESEEALLRAFNLNARNIHVNFHLAKFEEEGKQDYAKAAALYSTASLLTGGRYPAADLRAADCFAKLKRFDEARAALNRALAAEPGNTSTLFYIGKIEHEAGEYARATASYRKLLEVEPRNVQAWYNLGVSELSNKNVTEARRAFEKTVELDPKSEQGWYNLTFAAEQLRDANAAITAARQLASINPAKEEYKARLSALEKKYGSHK
jgi:tetratricopeptide (TPR) repeat protein